MTGEACPHGRSADTACPECSKVFKDAVLAGRADIVAVNAVEFAKKVQSVYDRLVTALEDKSQEEPGFGVAQCMASVVLTLVIMEVLAERMPSLQAEHRLMQLLFDSLKLKLMEPIV